MNEHAATFAPIADAFHAHQKFPVLSHVRPDGDALGSTLAPALSLRAMGTEVPAWNEAGMPAKYLFLAESNLLTTPGAP